MDAAYREIESEIVNRLIERIGDDRFDLWFEGKNTFRFNGDRLTIQSVEYFAQNRIKQSFVDEIRQVSFSILGRPVDLDFELVSHPDLSLATSNSIAPGSVPDSNHCASTSNLTKQSSGRVKPVSRRNSSNLIKFPVTNHDVIQLSETIDARPHNKVVTKKAPRKNFPLDSLSLENFCFGENNALLKSAVTQTVNQPGQFSPLYFYGPVGCGKTHLLRGIISSFRDVRRMSRCIYMTAEQFTSNFIEAIDGRGVSDFRRKCRGLEAIAIDDVQFFGGKRATLIEFQSTIETLVREGKQIILAGDCSLAELNCFEPELVNRIAGGLPCPVEYADSTSRKAILKKMISVRGMRVEQAVIDYLSQNLNGDVRHLSGALNRIQAMEMSGNGVAGLDATHRLIMDLVQASRSSVSIRDIEAAVGEFCGVPAREMRSESRSQAISTARMLAMFLSRQMTGSAFSEIGKHFGGRSHSTVISANRKIEDWKERNHFVAIKHSKCNVKEVLSQIESKLKRG